MKSIYASTFTEENSILLVYGEGHIPRSIFYLLENILFYSPLKKLPSLTSHHSAPLINNIN